MQKQLSKALILHGWGGSDTPHWQDYLARDLVSDGFAVYFPALPHRDAPMLAQWMSELETIINDFKPTIIVCHSLACMLFLHYCEKNSDISFDKVLLVAPPAQDTKIAEISSFFPYPTPNINARHKLLVASTNDRYATTVDAINLAMQTGCETHILEDAGHINTDAGYGEWKFALDWVKA
jgi:uncharacterized protein